MTEEGREFESKLSAAFLDLHERCIAFRGTLDLAIASGDVMVSVPVEDFAKLVKQVPLMVGYCLAALPMLQSIHKASMSAEADEGSCSIALAVVLDQVNYTKQACTPDELVGAVLPRSVIERAEAALHKRKHTIAVSHEEAARLPGIAHEAHELYALIQVLKSATSPPTNEPAHNMHPLAERIDERVLSILAAIERKNS